MPHALKQVSLPSIISLASISHAWMLVEKVENPPTFDGSNAAIETYKTLCLSLATLTLDITQR